MAPIRFSLTAVVLLLVCCVGCVMLGKDKEYQPFATSELEKLVPGKTTAADIVDRLGAPSEVVKLSNGNAYMYKRSVSKGTGLWLVLLTLGNFEKQYDQLVFFFDSDNLLTHYGASLNASKASYGFPF